MRPGGTGVVPFFYDFPEATRTLSHEQRSKLVLAIILFARGDDPAQYLDSRLCSLVCFLFLCVIIFEDCYSINAPVGDTLSCRGIIVKAIIGLEYCQSIPFRSGNQ